MPILDVQLVGAAPPPADLAQRIADAAGDVLSSRPQGTWVRVQCLDPTAYAENGGAAAGVQPVFVGVLLAQRPEPSLLSPMARRLADTIAEICDRPAENVHILFEPDARGRIAFGGDLVE